MKKFILDKTIAILYISAVSFGIIYFFYIKNKELSTIVIKDIFVVTLFGKEGNYLLDVMGSQSNYLGDKIVVNTNSIYSGSLMAKNNSMNSAGYKYQAKDGGLYDSLGKNLYISGWSNKANDFHWTRDGKYYVRFINPDPKASLSEKIYIYDLDIGKYKYFDLIDQTGNRITVNKVVGILP